MNDPVARLAAICRRIARLWKEALLFVAVALFWILCLGGLPDTRIFWRALDSRFAADMRYQIQRVYLPDDRRRIDQLIAGDPLFHGAFDAAGITAGERVILPGWDPDDLGDLLDGIRIGQQATRTRLCGLVVQIDPTFLIRARQRGPRLELAVLKSQRRRHDRFDVKRTERAFRPLVEWGGTRNDGPFAALAHGRADRLVAQARMADPTRENWDMIVKKLARFKGEITFVIDTRHTDFGAESDLVAAVERLRREPIQTASHAARWVSVDALDQLPQVTCPARGQG